MGVLAFALSAFILTDFGAKPDGSSCTEAFRRAVAAAAERGGGCVEVPCGTWTTGAIHLRSNVELHLADGACVVHTDDPADYLPAVRTQWEGTDCLNYSPLVYACGATNVAVTGRGVFRPRLAAWEKWQLRTPEHLAAVRQLYAWGVANAPWDARDVTRLPGSNLRPQFLQLVECRGVRLEDFTVEGSPFWMLHLLRCDRAEVRRVTVRSLGMHNNDGIDIDMSRDVLVEDCVFDTSDDVICLKAGRDADARRQNRPTERVTVRRCTAVGRRGHGFIAFGSELSGGIRDVEVSDCTASGRVERLVFVKTGPSRGGFVENIRISRLRGRDMHRVFALKTDYPPQWTGFAVTNEPTRIADIALTDVICESADAGIELRGSPDAPAKGLSLEGLRVAGLRGKLVQAVENAEFRMDRVEAEDGFATVCNPVDVGYRCALKGTPGYREGADPSVTTWGPNHWLFTSKCGGGYWSEDLARWKFVPMPTLPTEAYAPDVVRRGNRILHVAGGVKEVREAVNISTGSWRVCGELPFAMSDPQLFFDEDGRLYAYWGCSPGEPLWGMELDPTTFRAKGERVALYKADPAAHPWEIPGDANERKGQACWLEGAYVIRHGGRYYLHASAPGTEYRTYCDAVLVGDSPLGPFRLQKRNPVFRKTGGFATGGGHGCTFKDGYGNWWHLGTTSVSVNHKYERRLILYPVLFDEDGEMMTSSEVADGPMVLPQKKATSFADFRPGWIPLATNLEQIAISSSSVADEGHRPELAFDENVRTWWASKTGEKGEWLSVDLGREAELRAVQVNLADDRVTQHGYDSARRFAYRVEGSTDGTVWRTFIDESEPEAPDRVHAYFQLPVPVRVRHVRIVNLAVPSGRFAVSGLRLFGRSAF